MEDEPARDVYISHTASDRAWAEWIARVLDETGYSTVLQSRDVRPGNDPYDMHRAAAATRCILAVVSQRYLDDSPFGVLEVRTALSAGSSGRSRRLLPVRIGRCQPFGLLSSRVFVDLLELDEQAARAALLSGVAEAVPSPSGLAPGSSAGGSGGPPFPAGGAGNPSQRQQGYELLSFVELTAEQRVIEVGCGTGAMAVQVAPRVAHLHCVDVSPGVLTVAEDRADEAGLQNVTFEVADLLQHDAEEPFDVVLSNSTMHWITPAEEAYASLYRLLRTGGRLAVHQGGDDDDRGLRECAGRVVRRLHRDELFVGWKYPLYYPTRMELRDLLVGIGFEDVEVISRETDGSESPNRVCQFSVAGLLPFLHVLHESDREVFRTAFLEEAETRSLDLYTHRLYVTATRP